jgi:hypothetical protein
LNASLYRTTFPDTIASSSGVNLFQDDTAGGSGIWHLVSGIQREFGNLGHRYNE